MTKYFYCLATATFIAAILSSSSVAQEGEYSQGKALYEEKCVICHGANGKGDGPAAAALSPPPRDFNKPAFWDRKDVDQIIIKQVKNGKGAMPAFHLADDEIKAIIDYMSHTFNKSQ